MVRKPEHDNGSDSDCNQNGGKQDSYAEQHALKSIQLPVGYRHERSLVDTLRMHSPDPTSSELNHMSLVRTIYFRL